jgi:hypothetical protein
VPFELIAKAQVILKRFLLYPRSFKNMRKDIDVLPTLGSEDLFSLRSPLSVQGSSESINYVARGIRLILSFALVLRTVSFTRFERIDGLEKGN